jgi:hypothetical protein
MFRGVSQQEQEAITARERTELAEKIQLTQETERRMRDAQRGGRRLLLFDSILGTGGSKTGTQTTATMGSRG